MDWGKHINFLKKRAKKGKRSPAFESMPKLLESVRCVWDAFNELHKQRQVNGLAACPLQVGDIVHWLDLHQVCNKDRRLWFYELITEIDSAWLYKMRKNKKKDNTKNG